MLYKIKWEVLPPKIQKFIMLLIYRSQNERGLKLGPFGAGINRAYFKLVIGFLYFTLKKILLNQNVLESSARLTFNFYFIFFQSTNRIYTFIMFLINFFN